MSIIPVGINTNSKFKDFYVYEWVIRSTGEIFYVGKGRCNRATEYHYNNETAEKIRATHETDILIVRDNLSEEEALMLETQEIMRIKKETSWVLTNVSTPQGVSNAWPPSKTTPEYSFENAPLIYTSDVEEHYFGIKGRQYDLVDLNALKNVYINERMVWPEIKEVVFGGQYERYYEETLHLLRLHNSKILSSQYSKSLSSWIYCGGLSLCLYEDDQVKAESRIGHRIRAVHLIDVWKELCKKYGKPCIVKEKVEINPINNRVPLSGIPQFADPWNAREKGSRFLEKGFDYYYDGDYEKAIAYFDKARCEGCIDPVMFNYYAIMFRKLKDYDNEIDILDEAIMRYQPYNQDIYGGHILDFKKRREKAIELLKKSRSKV